MKESKGRRTQGAKEWKYPGTKGRMIGKEEKVERNETQLKQSEEKREQEGMGRNDGNMMGRRGKGE